MSNSDFIGLAASYSYATTLLVVGELLRRMYGHKQDLTRKIIHIGAGMWVFGVLVLFDHWEIGILPFATFIFFNYLFYRYRVFGAMDAESNSPGTVYFAISVTLLFGLLWRPDSPVDRVPIAVAGVMAMTWGDALAALIGKRIGQHRYRVGQSERSWEGSAAMFKSECGGDVPGTAATAWFVAQSALNAFSYRASVWCSAGRRGGRYAS